MKTEGPAVRPRGDDDIAAGMPVMLYPFPAAIIHLDADAFFASVEQAVNPALKGKPVVTGKERGIIASASYEAKALGIKRALSLREARKLCPQLVVLPSDYETYSLFSKRMFHIMRRFTPMVEESSIDEAYADIGGMRRVFHEPYEDIALRMKQTIHDELDITVSVGLSVTKSLAKLASKHKKPDGLTVVSGTRIHVFLRNMPVGEICGIGPNSVVLLGKYGIKTAYDFICRNRDWVSKLLGKPGRELWDELRGNSVYPVTTGERAPQASISKTKTFSAPSWDGNFVYARLVRNVESAFIKLRRHKLKTRLVGILLRHGNYDEEGFEAKLSRPTSATHEVLPMIRLLFDKTYRPGAEYRSAMVFLGSLTEEGNDQFDLFEDRLRLEQMVRVSRAIDEINRKYGKHSVSVGTSLYLQGAPVTDKDAPPARKKNLLKGESRRQRLNIPMLTIKV